MNTINKLLSQKGERPALRPPVSPPPVTHAPHFSTDRVLSFTRELYRLRVNVSSLPSERDQNFLLTDSADRKFVLKISNSLEDESLLLAQSEAMEFVGERLPFCQRLVLSVNGKILERVESESGGTNLVRLATYLPGVPLGEIRQQSAPLLKDLGYKIGQMDAALWDFDRPAIHRNFHWDLASWKNVIGEYAGLINEMSMRALILKQANVFEESLAPLADRLRKSCIHGDMNDYNILVNEDSSTVVGIIDFGDMVHSYTVADLSIGLAYVVLNNESPLTAATNVVAAYHEAFPLFEEELDSIWGLMLMRLCMSVCIAAYQLRQRPDNAYLEISQQAIKSRLPALMAIRPNALKQALLNANALDQ